MASRIRIPQAPSAPLGSIRPLSTGMLWMLGCLGLVLAGCGAVTEDGSCTTDFNCPADQLCGLEGVCLLCDNCDRGRVGTCTAPRFPEEQPPDAVRLEATDDADLLLYVYGCPGGERSYRYRRPNGEPCFEPEPRLDDGC